MRPKRNEFSVSTFTMVSCFHVQLYYANVIRTIIADNLRTYFFFLLADVCKNYKNLTDAERKYDYVTVNPKCDNTLNGWYRFQGAAGTKMVTTCPPMNVCDANFPAWLSEDHPTVAEGAVERKVCVHHFDGCCDKSAFIQVKNCGSYYIYYLKKLRHCNFRYCGTD